MIERLRAALRHGGSDPVEGLPERAASVAVVLHRVGEELGLLWIERAENPEDPWSGHMGFPGGKAEEGDASTLDTAVREAREELGLVLPGEAWLGELTPHPVYDRRGLAPFRLVAHAFWLESLPALTLDPAEVARVHRIGLSYMVDPGHRTSVELVWKEQKLTFPAIRFQEKRIWGLSYRVLVDLLGRLSREGLGPGLPEGSDAVIVDPRKAPRAADR